MRTPDTRMRVPVIGLLALTLWLAACTPQGSLPSPSATPAPTRSPVPSSTTPTPTETIDPEAAATAAILEAYAGYWDAKVASFADPAKDQDPRLQLYAVDTALADAQSAIFSFRTNGISVVGRPETAPVVSNVVLSEPMNATIDDCVDITNWQPVHTATGQSAAPADQVLRVPTRSTAYYFDGRWVIRTSIVDRDKTC